MWGRSRRWDERQFQDNFQTVEIYQQQLDDKVFCQGSLVLSLVTHPQNCCSIKTIVSLVQEFPESLLGVSNTFWLKWKIHRSQMGADSIKSLLLLVTFLMSELMYTEFTLSLFCFSRNGKHNCVFHFLLLQMIIKSLSAYHRTKQNVDVHLVQPTLLRTVYHSIVLFCSKIKIMFLPHLKPYKIKSYIFWYKCSDRIYRNLL